MIQRTSTSVLTAGGNALKNEIMLVEAYAGTGYGGLVYGGNGKFYGVPINATTILEIDPVTRTTSTFGSITGTDKYLGGALAPNGKIYCAPNNATAILEIDPVTRTTSTFGSITGPDKYLGIVSAQRGADFANGAELYFDTIEERLSHYINLNKLELNNDLV